MRTGGIVQTFAARSISSQRAPRTSPDRAAVKRDEEFDARLREFRLEHGLTPNSALHIVRVRFNDPEGAGKIALSQRYRRTATLADNSDHP